MSILANQVVAITGAASGIGLETSRRIFSLGAKISICDVDEEGLIRARDEMLKANNDHVKPDILIRRVNVQSSDEVDAWVSETVRTFGKLDAAVNVAGVGFSGTLLRDMSDSEWHRTTGVNLNGVFYCMRAELRAMSEGARIINMASIGGVIAVPGCSAYGAAKRAVIGLTSIAAHEEGTRGIRINAVAPGYIESPMTDVLPEATKKAMLARAMASPIARIGKPEDVARVVIFLLSEDSSFITGRSVIVDGGSISAI